MNIKVVSSLKHIVVFCLLMTITGFSNQQDYQYVLSHFKNDCEQVLSEYSFKEMNENKINKQCSCLDNFVKNNDKLNKTKEPLPLADILKNRISNSPYREAKGSNLSYLERIDIVAASKDSCPL